MTDRERDFEKNWQFSSRWCIARLRYAAIIPAAAVTLRSVRAGNARRDDKK